MTEMAWDVAATSPASSSLDFQVGPRDVPGTPDGWSVAIRTLSSGASAGVQLIEIDNGRMRLSVVASRGMGIHSATMAGERLGWNSPVRGPIHPNHVPLMEPSGVGWLEGFDELMVRCGLESSGSAVHDSQGRLVFPLHGKIANRLAHSLRVAVDKAAGTITVHGVVDEIRFHYQKLRLITSLTTRFHGTEFGWRDKVVNLGSAPAVMQMLYHINLGEPLLAPGATLVAPIREVCPHDHYPDDPALRDYRVYPEAGATASQQSFFFDLLADEQGATQVLLKHPAQAKGVAIRFNKRELPCFTQWRNNVPGVDGYVTGLEPGTNFPNPRPFEQQHDRIVALEPGGHWSAEAAMDWLTDSDSVAKAEARIRRLQGDVVPQVHESPLPSWSPR